MLIYSDVNIKIQTTYIVHSYKKNIGYQDLLLTHPSTLYYIKLLMINFTKKSIFNKKYHNFVILVFFLII